MQDELLFSSQKHRFTPNIDNYITSLSYEGMMLKGRPHITFSRTQCNRHKQSEKMDCYPGSDVLVNHYEQKDH